MRSEEVSSELAGIIGRLRTRLNVDPSFARALALDNEAHTEQVVLEGIEQAITGLVMLHIQVRRRRSAS